MLDSRRAVVGSTDSKRGECRHIDFDFIKTNYVVLLIRYKNCGVTCHKRDTPSGQYDANGSDSYEGATSFNFEMPSAAGPSESTMDELIEITPPVDIMPERIAAFDSTIGAFKSESEDTKSLSPEQLQRYVLLEQLRMFERQNCLIAKQQALCEIQLKVFNDHIA